MLTFYRRFISQKWKIILHRTRNEKTSFLSRQTTEHAWTRHGMGHDMSDHIFGWRSMHEAIVRISIRATLFEFPRSNWSLSLISKPSSSSSSTRVWTPEMLVVLTKLEPTRRITSLLKSRIHLHVAQNENHRTRSKSMPVSSDEVIIMHNIYCT